MPFSDLLRRPETRADAPSQTETKSANHRSLHDGLRGVLAYHQPGQPVWTSRNYGALARAGLERNVVAYRCVRMIAEAAASAPLKACRDSETVMDHPVLNVLRHPNGDQSHIVFLEQLYSYLQSAGNSYVEAVALQGEVRELHILRPDRMTIRADKQGWVDGYDYEVNGRKVQFQVPGDGTASPILHLKLFHPLSDHYGLSPLAVAASNIDVHNGALAWNKALLDNAARPSGALVYRGPEGAQQLSADQFERLKSELSDAYTGSANAGKPLLLEGGLDWQAMSLSPADMDFIEARHSAARDIALAFGVPPMLLGIPGDNTYANYREANVAFWKQTVLPLVKKTAAALTGWLQPQLAPNDYGFQLRCEASDLDVLAEERDARWQVIANANFLSDDEKRALLGLPKRTPAAPATRGVR
ncbi:MAG: phage portal protein [Pseudomonadota bacterium]